MLRNVKGAADRRTRGQPEIPNVRGPTGCLVSQCLYNLCLACHSAVNQSQPAFPLREDPGRGKPYCPGRARKASFPQFSPLRFTRVYSPQYPRESSNRRPHNPFLDFPSQIVYVPRTMESLSAETSSILDELLTEPSGHGAMQPIESEVSKWPSGAARGVQKLRYTHEAMVDQIIANPAISQNELAAIFGYSPSWVSQVIASDAFQAKLAERSRDLVDPTIRATVEDHFKGMVLRSLDILKAKLDRTPEAIPDNLALRTLELSSRALGYGVRDPVTRVEVNVEAHLEGLGEGLTKLLQRKRGEASGPPAGDKPIGSLSSVSSQPSNVIEGEIVK